MKLIENNIESINNWLESKLNKNNSIKGKLIELEKVPAKKGIYFWFMKSDLYEELSKHVEIYPIDTNYSRNINGVNYDLIYLGTAGTSKSGKSNLRERLNWHLNPEHVESNICSGYLSTFRAGLASVLSNDLQIDNTAELVSEFQESLIIYWLPYNDNEIEIIDSDEKILIQTIRPLFNIKNNPNAKSNSAANSTKIYKKRRAIVYESTRNRLNCFKLSNISSPIITKGKQLVDNPPSYEHQILEKNNCITFNLLQSQSVHDVVNGISDLPKGKCTFLIHDAENPDSLIYVSRNNHGWRITGNKLGQNIYSYFANIDTKIDNRKRWEIIQSEMIEKNIEEAVVTVCEYVDSTSNNPKLKKSDNVPPDITDNAAIEVIISDRLEAINFGELKNKKKLLIIGCSDHKNSGGIPQLQNDVFTKINLPTLLSDRLVRLNQYQNMLHSKFEYFNNKKRGTLNVDYSYFNECVNNHKAYLPAYERYRGGRFYSNSLINKYLNKNKKSDLHILIISGLYGVIEFRDSIIDYHLKINAKSIWSKKSNHVLRNAIERYIQLNNIENEAVFYSLSNDYIKALKPIDIWNNIWIKHDRGQTSAKFLLSFLSRL